MNAEHDPSDAPVFGVDIDGTLGQYHVHFQQFAEAWVGRRLGDTEAPYDYGQPFNQYLGLSKPVYRMVKLAYRRGGLKRSMPAYPFADQFTAALRAEGGVLVICTTRPYNQHDGIENDTVEWLRRNRIQFDYIMQGERKYIELDRRFGERVVCVFDDLIEMCKQADRKKITAIQVTHGLPALAESMQWSTVAFGLRSAEGHALNALEHWRKAR